MIKYLVDSCYKFVPKININLVIKEEWDTFIYFLSKYTIKSFIKIKFDISYLRDKLFAANCGSRVRILHAFDFSTVDKLYKCILRANIIGFDNFRTVVIRFRHS